MDRPAWWRFARRSAALLVRSAAEPLVESPAVETGQGLGGGDATVRHRCRQSGVHSGPTWSSCSRPHLRLIIVAATESAANRVGTGTPACDRDRAGTSPRSR